jgi:CubicO group peptidase (beta-lactamase class C family)
MILVTLAASATPNLQQVLDDMRLDQEIPGVSAVVTLKGEVLFSGASGQADIETNREMTSDTVLYAGSLSKVLTAVVTLQLVEDGLLSLDETVSGIGTTRSGDAQPIMLRHLLTHTSGLEREGDFGYWFSADFPDKFELAQYLSTTDLAAEPGTAFRYSNVGFAALGRVIEQSGQQEYPEALQTRLLGPLKMNASGAPGPGPKVARGYTPPGRLIPNAERPFAGVGNMIGNRHLREYHDAGAMTPAFGVYTTAEDLGRFVRFLLGFGDDGVLSRDMRETMLTPQGSGWGLGLRVGQHNDRAVARHSGWFAAHRSHLLLDLESSIGIVVMTNSDSSSPDEIAEALLAAALESASTSESVID